MVKKTLILLLSMQLILPSCLTPTVSQKVEKAKHHLDQNEIAQASALLQEEEKTNPRSAEVQYLLGWIYFQEGRTNDALAKFGSAIKNNKNFFGGYNGMGVLLMIQGNFPQSLEYLHKAEKMNPKAPEIKANLAELHMLMGRLDDAEEYLTKAKIATPQTGDYDFLLAQHHYRRGNWDKAAKFLEQSTRQPIKRKVLEWQQPCLKAGLDFKGLEKKAEVSPAKEFIKTNRKQIENTHFAFEGCRRKDPRRFDFTNEQRKVETWLTAKK